MVPGGTDTVLPRSNTGDTLRGLKPAVLDQAYRTPVCILQFSFKVGVTLWIEDGGFEVLLPRVLSSQNGHRRTCRWPQTTSSWTFEYKNTVDQQNAPYQTYA